MTCDSLMGLPGPAEFFRAVSEDLRGRNCIVVGVPLQFSGDLMWECFGHVIRSATSAECEVVKRSSGVSSVSEVIGSAGPTCRSFYIDARDSGDAVATDWNRYVNREGRMLDYVGTTVCVVLGESLARRCRIEKHFRRILWCDYVTDLDSRALAMEHVRQLDYSREHIALKISLVGALCGEDLALAERYSACSLKELVNADEYCRYAIWSGQVSVLFPLVELERRRLLRRYDRLWRLPPGIESLSDLDIGEMKRQAKGKKSISRVDYLQIMWLHDVRNDLAHTDCISWRKLMSSPVFVFE